MTIHAVRSIDQARAAFDALVSALEPELRDRLVSYGLLLDDLDIYRAIVNRRPVGIIHPQSRAARALADVARLLLERIYLRDYPTVQGVIVVFALIVSLISLLVDVLYALVDTRVRS